MNNFLTPAPEGHWYKPNGSPFYQIEMATKPGQFRPTTLGDAKKFHLLPGASSILNVLRKPELDQWMYASYIKAALALKPRQGESEDEFAYRVIRESRTAGRQAADFGTHIHALVELYLDKIIPPDLDAMSGEFLEGFAEWEAKNKIEVIGLEQSFANTSEGYGGRLDCLAHMQDVFCLIDWKTQKTSPGKPINFRKEWGPQLAAYKKGVQDVDEDEPLMVSVVISSTEPGRIQAFTWFDGDDQYWKEFLWCRDLYYSSLGPGHGLEQWWRA